MPHNKGYVPDDLTHYMERVAELRDEVLRLRAMLKRAHDALDVEHAHTTATWDDRESIADDAR